MNLRKPRPGNMSHQDLLAEYRSLHAWAMDGFSVSTPEKRDYDRMDRLEAEILRRMGVPNDA